MLKDSLDAQRQAILRQRPNHIYFVRQSRRMSSGVNWGSMAKRGGQVLTRGVGIYPCSSDREFLGGL